MNQLTAYFNLFRWHNLLFVAALMVFFRFFIVLPVFEANGIESALSHLNFALLVLATLMISAAGYAINDYFDLRKDRINRPESIVIGRVLPRRSAIFWQWILNTLGGIIGIYISWYVKFFPLAIVFFSVPFLLWLYGFIIKRWFIFGNVFISVLSTLIIFMVWAVEFEAAKYLELPAELVFKGRFYTLVYSVLFFFLFFALEIVKDFIDFEGDERTGCRTFPVVLGKPVARNLVVALFIVVMHLAVVYVFWLSKNFHLYSVIFFVLLVLVPLAFMVFRALKPVKIWKVFETKLMVKLVMLALVFSFIVQSFYIV